MSGEIAVVHGYYGGQIPLEHVLPFLLPDVLPMIRSCSCLSRPFLLEEGSGRDIWCFELGEGV